MKLVALRRSPKLFPFYALLKLYRAMGLSVSISDLTDRLPAAIYDVREVDGVKFGVRLFRPRQYGWIYQPFDKEAFLSVRPRRGDCALDIGAHIGTYSLRYSKMVGPQGQVIAFEPEPENRRLLSWNVRLNNAHNVLIRGEAVGDFTGTAELKLSSLSGHHSLVRSIRQVGKTTVPVIRLDDLCLSRVDIIKIDVEGYEMGVLKGAERTIRSLRPRMQIEVHQQHSMTCEVCNWLEDKGFSTKVLREDPEASGHFIGVV